MFVVALGIGISLSFLFQILGLAPYLQQNGISYESLLIFCVVFGFAGSFISLFLSKWMVKRSLRVEVIEPSRARGDMLWLFETVRRLSDHAGLPKTPEVGVYSSPELNAFATGPTRSDSLVAVSTGLLSSMNREEIEGVLAHEVAHIANGDMVRMALMQGIVNTLILFVARVIAFVIASRLDERQRGASRFMITMVIEILLGVVGMIVVNTYSRLREFRADRGGASLAGRHKMIAALQALKDRSHMQDRREPQLAAFKISNIQGGFGKLLMTHPPIGERIEALRRGV